MKGQQCNKIGRFLTNHTFVVVCVVGKILLLINTWYTLVQQEQKLNVKGLRKVYLDTSPGEI